MLRSVFLNSKKIPVPIPMKSLQEVVDWVNVHLLSKDRIITKITFNDVDIEFNESVVIMNRSVEKNSDIHFRIDSPLDLSVQTLDALRNLVSVLEKQIDSIAVKLWQSESCDRVLPLDSFKNDMDLLLDLTDHLLLLVEDHVDVTNVKNTWVELQRLDLHFQKSYTNRNWKLLAKLLVKELKPCLIDLSGELDGFQRILFESQLQQNNPNTANQEIAKKTSSPRW